jgi:hypothetical protein
MAAASSFMSRLFRRDALRGCTTPFLAALSNVLAAFLDISSAASRSPCSINDRVLLT